MCSSTAVGKASTLGRLNAELSTVQLHGTAVDVGPGPNKGSLGEWISVSVCSIYSFFKKMIDDCIAMLYATYVC